MLSFNIEIENEDFVNQNGIATWVFAILLGQFLPFALCSQYS